MAEQKVPETVMVEESQLPGEQDLNTQAYEYKANGTVGVMHSQQTEWSQQEDPAAEVPVAQPSPEESEQKQQDPPEQGEGTKQDGEQVQETKQDGEQGEVMKQDGEQGKETTPNGEPGKVLADSTALQRASLAWLEQPDDDAELQATCKTCKQVVSLNEAIIRGPKELWCRECNALYSMLRRHQSWPPQSFARLSEDAQMDFFQKCKKQKQESEKGQMSYSRVRDILVNTLVEEQRRERTTEVGGTFLPKSVYVQRGYVVDQDFEKRNPRRWSDGLNDWVYLLAEVSINEKEVHASVERQVVEAERNVRKRKAQALEQGGDATPDVASTASTTLALADGNLDLESEEEAEGMEPFF